jgi:flagellar protein FlaI
MSGDTEVPELEGDVAEDSTDTTEPVRTRPSRWNVTEEGTPPEADPEILGEMLDTGAAAATLVDDLEDERTLVITDVDEDAFFGIDAEERVLTTRYDMEKAVPMEKKTHFREVQRYWVNEPYAFVSIYHSNRENEKKYYVTEPYLNDEEKDLLDFLDRKLRNSIKYGSGVIAIDGSDDERKAIIEETAHELIDRYDLYEDDGETEGALLDRVKAAIGRFMTLLGRGGDDTSEDDDALDIGRKAQMVRPEFAVLEEDRGTLDNVQIEKLLYYLKRNFIGFERIDPIKHDINVEDISCDGYESPVFVYHGSYEQLISNIYHGTQQLDTFVVKLAQRSGKGISKRNPQVDCTLPDGSRAQLTLGAEVSDHGTNYTIRQFKEVPFTPIDLTCWRTFGLDQMAFLWLCIENGLSLIFAGGTASGKTTSLNAVSLFIPSKSKIVSIEDTREVELPQRNWIASVTRPSFSGDDSGGVDEFDLLEAALRQRPEYIVQGEIRGEEGRTLFQVMSTGHTTYATFHADSVGEVIKRFTTEPINVSKTMFTALDLVSIQTQTRVNGNKVRRSKTITEINDYNPETDEISVQNVYQWEASTDEFEARGSGGTIRGTQTFEELMERRGWSSQETWDEVRKRELVLAYLIQKGLNTYAQVAATLQAFMNDQDTVLTLIANDQLEESLESLREMESVQINVDAEKEEQVPRPTPDDALAADCDRLLTEYQDLLEPFVGQQVDGMDLADTLSDVDLSPDQPELVDDEGDQTPPELEGGGDDV